MDPSFSSYHFNLAQMPTDQREREQHLTVQTGVSRAEGILPVNAWPSQPYYPCPPGQNWSTSRSNLTPGSMFPYRHTGYVNEPWNATMSEPYELSSGQLPHGLMPEDAYASVYSVPQPHLSSMIASTTTMESQPSPSAPKFVGNDDDFMNWPTGPTPITPSFVPHGTFYPNPAQMETSEGRPLATRVSCPSPPPAISISSQQSPTRSFDSMSPAASATAADPTSPQTSFGDNSDQDVSTEPPYSKLIYDALMSTQERMMPLQEIYAWFEKNTSKGKDKNKGWQNSIRHNLSMNAAFEAFKKEEPGKKPINYWRLTAEAMLKGVQSTTRYRKANHRKVMTSDPPVLGRQRSGSKGGRAARYAAKMRCTNHTNPEEQRRERNLQSSSLHPPQQLPQLPHSHPSLEHSIVHPTPPAFPIQHHQPQDNIFEHHPIPNGLPVPAKPSEDYIQTFDLGNTTDITSPACGENAVFCDDAAPNLDCSAFDMGQLDWYRLASGLNSGLISNDGF